MFTIRHYEQPNRYKFTSLRSERIKKQKRTALKNKIFTATALLVLVLAIGYVGEQDRQYELISNGVTAEKASK